MSNAAQTDGGLTVADAPAGGLPASAPPEEPVQMPGDPPALDTPVADALYRRLQRAVPSLAPNRRVGVLATGAVVVMIGVASNQGGIIESLDVVHRFGAAPYGPTWALLVLGAVQLIYLGWSAREQTVAENAQKQAQYRQEVARYEQARGFTDYRRARDIQQGLLQAIVLNQEAARETLPTAQLSIAFRDTAKQVQIAVESGRDPNTLPPVSAVIGLVDDAIQTALWAILQFVRKYDQTVRPDDTDGAMYSANVMLYVAISSASPERRRALGAHLECNEDGVTIDGLSGVLALRQEWSAIAGPADDPATTRDGTVPALVLPVPPWGDARVALPGGPRAWQVAGDLLQYGDVTQLRAHVLNTHCGTERVADAVAAHFAHPSVAHVQSFMSTALVAPEDIDESSASSPPADAPALPAPPVLAHSPASGGPRRLPSPPIGVVNINCSVVGLLGERSNTASAVDQHTNRHLRVLAPFLRALLYPLTGLIEYRLWVEEKCATPPVPHSAADRAA